ncbi:MAG: DUF302 domain-containing protein [Desulfurella sp.]|uniref:DUF302 domain-containing protein n=1 Tax=Desulfurella sp. TaxID=1962857 RepID=UPI003D0DCEB4
MKSSELIKKVKLPFGFEAAKEKFENLVKQSKGWSFPVPMWDFNKSIISSGFELKNIKNMVIYFLCNASYASQIVNAQDEMSSLLPCTYVIFETDNNETFLSAISIGLLAEFFPDPVKKIIQEVSDIEDLITEEMLSVK